MRCVFYSSKFNDGQVDLRLITLTAKMKVALFLGLVSQYNLEGTGSDYCNVSAGHPSKRSPIHSTSLEMSEVSSETDMLLISVPQQTDSGIFR